MDAEDLSPKYHHISTKYAKSYINRELFNLRYPFFIFDFRDMESKNKASNTPYEIEYKLNAVAPAAGVSNICKILVIEAATIQLTQRGSKTDRVI